MLNYEIEPAVLAPFLPRGTELDSWNGRTFVSVVGFLFLQTRVFGIPIPCHRNFEEVNLRFYVRRQAESGWRRGVVFLKELVPRLAIAAVARWRYHEPYQAVSMSHEIKLAQGVVQSAAYTWQFARRAQVLKLVTKGAPQPLSAGGPAEFITEHYWGYNRQRDGATLEYQVEHPAWRVQEAAEASLDCDVAALYGEPFSASLNHRPASAFLAEGSAVKVYQGVRLSP